MIYGFLILLNKVYKQQLELLYGKNSSVDIDDLFFCNSKKTYIIKCKLNIGESKLFEETGEDGLNFLIYKSLTFMGINNKEIIIQTSFDLL